MSLLSKGLWPQNLAKWWLTKRNFNSLSHTTLWTCGHVRSPDKLKIFYLQYYNIYAYQTWQSGYIQEEPSFHKFTSILSRGLVSGLSYTMCRSRMQTHKSSPISCSPSCSSPQLFRNFGEFRAKVYFIDHRTALIQSSYLLLQKESCQVYSVSEQVAAKGNSPETTW